MKKIVFAFLLCGCGGPEFTSGFSATEVPVLDAADAAPMTAAGGAPGTGGSLATGGARETGGSLSTGGAPKADAGSGGVVGSTGGARETGGAPAVDACVPVTHNNGLGATWDDCVPLGTYDQEQAMKACRSSGAASCIVDTVCSGAYRRVYGVSGSQGIGSWLFSGTLSGQVSPWNAPICAGSSDPRNKSWD